MNRKCRVAIPAHTEEIRQSKTMFKREWAKILMDAETTNTSNAACFHVTTGVLIDFFGGKGVIAVGDGILLSLPAHCIQLLEE